MLIIKALMQILGPNKIKHVLSKLTFSLLHLVHLYNLSSSRVIVAANLCASEFDRRTVVSSANNTIFRTSEQWHMSLMQMLKRTGPMIEPWGTPLSTFKTLDLCFLICT